MSNEFFILLYSDFMIDEAYEKFDKMEKQDYEILKQLCNCENCENKDDEDGLYEYCAHFNTCATDIILRTMER